MSFDPMWLFLSLIPSGIGFVLFVLGTVVVFTFDPSQWPGTV